ncbi:GntR family transcriptional regulator [Hahella sp. CCB-MM4]|uniref:aminotransferase-like domain-containing protein n=1 Tax=Hahella sp. (strain CCB-MM4) TaxID=1926491 RepID=UPI000B9A73B7|nr:PLP-dependent aminotransferase family protein [Hahella sp. CCB-MM4]OZG70353.1 GntR family transcriptional regulator [Hahella sp. CCB-MM4]
MKRYEQLANDIAELIRSGVLSAGQRAPSVRQASKNYGVSASTVFQAYYLLENKGLLRAKPRSGYIVCSQPNHHVPAVERAQTTLTSTPVDVSKLVFSVLGSVRDPSIAPFGSAFPSPALFPMQRLAKSMAKATRMMDLRSLVSDLPPGNQMLLRQIALRYGVIGVKAPIDEIIVTNGAMEALNLCLQAVTRPGDLVAIESPAFYASLQVLERLQLQAVEIPVDAKTGIDLNGLEGAFKKHPIRACWFMTNFQNPVGVSLTERKKQELVNLLHRYQVPLIEDDVYNELFFGKTPPKPAKAFDQEGLVMHCCSYSKSLAPGYRVGWVSGGRYAKEIEQLKLMTTISAAIPSQVALADYLEFGGYDRHLRKLRNNLEIQQNKMRAAITRYLPEQTRVSRPEGGYFLWLEMPEQVDSLKLFNLALRQGISIAPGPIFSATRRFRNYIRLNYGYPWGPNSEAAMENLGKIARSL